MRGRITTDADVESETIQTEAQKPKKRQKQRKARKEVTGTDFIEHSGAAGERMELEVEERLNAKTIRNLKVIEGTYIGEGGEKVVYQHKNITSANPEKAIRGYIGKWATHLRSRRLWEGAKRSANALHKGELHFELPESVHDPSIVKELRFTVMGKRPKNWGKIEQSLRQYFDDKIPTENKRIAEIQFIETVSAEDVAGK